MCTWGKAGLASFHGSMNDVRPDFSELTTPMETAPDEETISARDMGNPNTWEAETGGFGDKGRLGYIVRPLGKKRRRWGWGE